MRSVECRMKGCGGMMRSPYDHGGGFRPCDKCGRNPEEQNLEARSGDAIAPSKCAHTLWSSPHVVGTALHSVFCHLCRKWVIATPEQCRQWASGSNGIPPPGPSELPDSTPRVSDVHLGSAIALRAHTEIREESSTRGARECGVDVSGYFSKWTKQAGEKLKAEIAKLLPPWVQFDEVMQSMGYHDERTTREVRAQNEDLRSRNEALSVRALTLADVNQELRDDETKLHARISRLERELERKK